MSHPVDLTNLRSMIDGDTELEKALLEEFCQSSEIILQDLATHQDLANSAIWRSKAHALKGASLNLGAQQLGELCKQAQEAFEAEPIAKTALLSEIQAEYDRVKQFLLTV